MKTEFRILIIEDSEELISSWKRDIREYNQSEGHKVTFSATFECNYKDSISRLQNERFDCAVSDLRIPNSENDGASSDPLGNSIAEYIISHVGIPTIIYSGYIVEASETVANSPIESFQKEGVDLLRCCGNSSLYATLLRL